MPRAKKRRRGRPSFVARLSLADLTKELDRRRGMMGDLVAQRDDLAGQIANLDAQIAELQALGGLNGRAAVTTSKRGRPNGTRNGRNGKPSLASVLHSVLKGKTMNIAQMAEAAKKAGHTSKSKRFNTVISLALLNHKSMFKRVSRGMYTAK